MLNAVLALVPSLGVLFLFVVVVKAMLEGDRRERVAQAKWDREQAGPQVDAITDPLNNDRQPRG